MENEELSFKELFENSLKENENKIVKSVIHYIFFSKLTGEKHYIKSSPKKFLTLLLTPAGALYYKKMTTKKD